MYDISRLNRHGWQDSTTADQRRQMLADLAKQRWADVDAGEPALQPTQLPEGRVGHEVEHGLVRPGLPVRPRS